MANICGIHDIEGIQESPIDTWIVDTISLSENPSPKNYPSTYHILCRCNYGYGSTGTIPLSQDQGVFYERLNNYVRGSKGCSRWIIGNETNLPREWPQGQAIHPKRYAEFFVGCVQIIKKISGHEKDEILIAGSGPWNDQYKYPGNERGDWIKYFTDCIDAISILLGGNLEGISISIHSYTHGYEVNLVTSEARMNAPFQDRHYEFRTYRDYCSAIPEKFSHLPIYLTEANGNGEWKAVGLIPAMANEIDSWNQQSRGRKIKSLVFYRYPPYDANAEFCMQNKPEVMKEYKNTVALGIQSPTIVISTPPVVPTPVIPEYNQVIVPGKPEGKVSANVLNVRSFPGVNSKIIGQLKKGEKVSILEEKNINDSLWDRIGENAWVSDDWIERDDTPDTRSCWERAREFTGGWEGGFQNLHGDIGNWTGCEVGKGENKGTKYGISACSYPSLDIKNITREQADQIYFEDYWKRSGADELEWPLCALVFDTAINFHPTTAAKWLEQSEGDLLHFMALRLRGYRRSKTWKLFGDAWVDRSIDLMLKASE